jgi:hypothetical protein
MTFENNINIENVDIKFSMRSHHGHVLMVVISAISGQSVLLVEVTGVPGEKLLTCASH